MSTPPPVNPVDQFMEMAAAAVALRGLFEAYVSAGFTEAQAMQFLLSMMAGAAGGRR